MPTAAAARETRAAGSAPTWSPIWKRRSRPPPPRGPVDGLGRVGRRGLVAEAEGPHRCDDTECGCSGRLGAHRREALSCLRSRVTPGGLHPIELEPLHEVRRPGERRQVPAVHFVGGDAQPFPYDPAKERGREEALVPAQDESGGDVGPRVQRPRLFEGRAGLPAESRRELCRHVRGEIVGEDLLRVERVGKDVTGVRPPFARRFARSGHHRRHEDDQARVEAHADERRGEPAEGLGHHDHITFGIGRRRVGDAIGVLGQSRTVVIAGQVDRDDVVTPRGELRPDQVPVPGVVAGTVNEHVGRHRVLLSS